MRRQSRSLQVSILFAYFLFLLAGVSFDNMQKIKNGTCIVSACYDEKQMREEWEQKLIWDKEDFPGLPQEGDTVGISYYFYDEKGRLDSVKSYGKLDDAYGNDKELIAEDEIFYRYDFCFGISDRKLCFIHIFFSNEHLPYLLPESCHHR